MTSQWRVEPIRTPSTSWVPAVSYSAVRVPVVSAVAPRMKCQRTSPAPGAPASQLRKVGSSQAVGTWEGLMSVAWATPAIGKISAAAVANAATRARARRPVLTVTNSPLQDAEPPLPTSRKDTGALERSAYRFERSGAPPSGGRAGNAGGIAD